jgi:hypothetical protein
VTVRYLLITQKSVTKSVYVTYDLVTKVLPLTETESEDSPSSDCSLFASLKQNLRGDKYKEGGEPETAVTGCLITQGTD